MEYNKKICDFVPGDSIEGFYILSDAQVKTASNGGRFLSGKLGDNTGKIDFKLWDYTGNFSDTDNGRVIKIRGEVSEYKGTPQITVQKIRFANNGEYQIEELVPSAPIDIEERISEIETIIFSIQDPDYRRVAETIFNDNRDTFVRIPAAKSIHHGFRSGLLMHTSNMLRLALSVADIYDDVVNRDLLITGTLLHDIAKIKEFQLSELGTVTAYSTEGLLLGHLVMGAMEVKETAERLNIPKEKSLLLEHMLISHHGQLEFGAAVRPMFLEAELLYQIDSMDSRVEIYSETLQDIKPREFSNNKIFGLDHLVYNHG